jgi:four helix bundle protein
MLLGADPSSSCSMRFKVLDAARGAVDEVNLLLDRGGLRMLQVKQLRDSAGGITANIREAYGRKPGPERNQYLRVARSCAGETDEHLRTNFGARRLAEKVYWRLHNRLQTVIKMLNRLMGE